MPQHACHEHKPNTANELYHTKKEEFIYEMEESHQNFTSIKRLDTHTRTHTYNFPYFLC